MVLISNDPSEDLKLICKIYEIGQMKLSKTDLKKNNNNNKNNPFPSALLKYI